MNVITALAVSCLFMLPVAAQQQNEHAHGAPDAPAAGQGQAPSGRAMDMNCMNMSEHMQAMQKRMEAMQKRMEEMERERGRRRR